MSVNRTTGEVIGLKAIADAVGVSTATVSRVINNRPGVRAEVRRTVEQAIRERGLHVDAAARALRSRKTWKLAIMTAARGDLVYANPFFGEILRGISSVTEEAGYSLVMMTAATSETLEGVNRNRSCDGVLVTGFRKGIPEPRSLKGATVPVVTIPRPGPRYRLPFVAPDDEAGAYDATRYLIDCGHKRIALVSGPFTNIFTVHRLAGYRRALADAGLRFDSTLVVNGEYAYEGAYRAALTLLDQEARPDAVFATSDHMATGVLSALRSRGVRIPDDVALVGFGNAPLAELITPGLTTVDEQLRETGVQAATLLIRLAQGEEVAETQIVLPTRLVVRESA